MLDPFPSAAWNYESAEHLLNRATFGATPDEVEAFRQEGLLKSVSRLLEVKQDAVEVPPPGWAHPEDLQQPRMAARMAKDGGVPDPTNQMKEFRELQVKHLLDLRHWWLNRMITTPAPLLEKMTLFWHGHFATSAEKVQNGYWMWRQNDTLRRGALGNFIGLAKAMSRDPAMMIYLDLQQSQKEHPNENWARELMELFMVGIGNYSENDIRESARAFTGYRLDNTDQQPWFAPRQHDDGPKTFMAQTGAWTGDDIIDLLGKQPACARFIATKLWRFFAEDEPAAPIVEALAARISAHNYEMRPVLWEMFSSAEFYAPRVQRSQIKSPVQYLVGTTKLLSAKLPPPAVTQNAMRQMGQMLFAPPNVKGWDGGKSWVSTSTLLFRYNFANYLINGDTIRPNPGPHWQYGADSGVSSDGSDGQREPVDVSRLISAELRDQPNELVLKLSRHFLGDRVREKEHAAFVRFLEQRPSHSSDETIRELLHLMMSTPQFQLV